MGKCNVGTAHFRNSRVTMPRVRTPPLSNAAMTYRRGATFASSHHICIQRGQKRLRCTCSSHLCIKSVTCLLVFYPVYVYVQAEKIAVHLQLTLYVNATTSDYTHVEFYRTRNLGCIQRCHKRLRRADSLGFV